MDDYRIRAEDRRKTGRYPSMLGATWPLLIKAFPSLLLFCVQQLGLFPVSRGPVYTLQVSFNWREHGERRTACR